MSLVLLGLGIYTLSLLRLKKLDSNIFSTTKDKKQLKLTWQNHLRIKVYLSFVNFNHTFITDVHYVYVY